MQPNRNEGSAQDNEHGREASSPREISKPGWKDILMRVKREMSDDHLSIVAAGVALYWFLALFPLMIAFISIYGLVADPAQAGRQVDSLASGLPAATREFLNQQMERLAGQGKGGLSWGVAIGILAAIWSASKGVKAMMQSLNIVYDEEERRGFLKSNLVALGLTALIILMSILALAAIVLLPIVFHAVGLGQPLEMFLGLLKWPVLLALIIGVLALLYRWAPSRERAQWKWITPGALVASVVWVAGSWAFSFFVQNFGNYSNTYGSLAAIIILILWFNLSAYIVLLGGEINAEIEHQTRRDTTTGGEEPMGERKAHVADTLGETAEDGRKRKAS